MVLVDEWRVMDSMPSFQQQHRLKLLVVVFYARTADTDTFSAKQWCPCTLKAVLHVHSHPASGFRIRTPELAIRAWTALVLKVVDVIESLVLVLAGPKTFATTCAKGMKLLMESSRLSSMFDERDRPAWNWRWAAHAMLSGGRECAQTYRRTAESLIKDYSYAIDDIPGARVDIVGSVISLIIVWWSVDCLMRIPPKTQANPRGLFKMEQEVLNMSALIFT
ncbi:uncharacterized protein PHACADRAFT_206348 [Phanerochaete carnosa HHB-10118-sp]|uniref:Uncharacterized protein n=1 Tax=Phanerochaete carnosa (strain HHB-10118-sp) TaxID=650164 RepID=K5WED9_PHACS|nr:uncharacterized protein PHACADRAFT_206348 [Phanerochaete carnosa HHB-10118-sp]EKM57424.1 hypothetical protein PHACADRAFT_206348 [Phanerochaete carnosa HHB-10118-sp]